MYKERVLCELGARSRLLQERLTGEDDENAECPSEIATVLVLQSDGISPFPTPSNKSHHRVTNIQFNILKCLLLTNSAIIFEKSCYAMIIVVGVSGRHCRAKYSYRQWHLFTNYWRKSFVQNVCSYFLDTVVQFSIFTSVMLRLERFISVIFSLSSLEIQGSAHYFYELREPSSW